MLRRRLALLSSLMGFTLMVLAACESTRQHTIPQPAQTAAARNGMVVCRSPLASDIGRQVLEDGGNAVDAAVAVALAMAVTWPEAGNIGGGGFMLVHPGHGRDPVFVDYREKAPALAQRDTFVHDQNALSHRAVGVPGTVAGLFLAHKTFGKLPWQRLAIPAVKLARDGFVVSEGLAQSFEQFERFGPKYQYLRDYYNAKSGEVLFLPELADTLQAVANRGADGFYKGKVARLLVDEMQRGGGLIRMQDLADYRAKLRKPIHTVYRGNDIWGAPPPSSGGICHSLMLQMLEPLQLRKKGRWSLDTVHAMTEAMRRAFLARARHLGDPDFVAIPAHLTSRRHAAKLRKSISFARATRSEDLAPDIAITPRTGESTTHFSIIDKDGMAVSNTYTLEHSYGSRVLVKGAGFLLNNEMGDFNWQPGVTNHRGRIGTEANTVAPGKRMLSSMSPTIVSKDGKVVLVAGSPGGRTIINTVFGIVFNVLEFGMSIDQANAAARMHHQWLPDRLYLESWQDHHSAKLVSGLQRLGHTIGRRRRQGDVNAIQVMSDGRYRGVADPRWLGKAVGY